MKKFTILLALSLQAMQATSAVPNTFVAGTPAKASEVNQNFTSLDTRVSTVERVACAGSESPMPISITHAVIASNTGDVVNLNVKGVSQPFRIVTIPFADVTTGNRYTVKLPANDTSFNIRVSNIAESCFNSFTISGYPAKILGYETQSIRYDADSFTIDKSIGNEGVFIKVGNALLSFDLPVYGSSTATGFRAGSDYDLSDNITSTQLTTRLTATLTEIDNYIDYIVIEALP